MARKLFTGKIVSSKTPKTVVVEIERMVSHPVYKKIVKRTKRIKAHITDGTSVVLGQLVRIEQSRPMSGGKNFKVVEIIKESLQPKSELKKKGKEVPSK